MNVVEFSTSVLLLNELLEVAGRYGDQDLRVLQARLKEFDVKRMEFINTLSDDQKELLSAEQVFTDSRKLFAEKITAVLDDILSDMEHNMAIVEFEGFDNE